MQNHTLPAVNQRVDVWFDGYDEYYGGRVESVTHPYKFHVILDDGSAWDIDIRKNIYRLSNLPQDNDNDHDIENEEGNAQGLEKSKRGNQITRRNSKGSSPTKMPTTDDDGDSKMEETTVNTPRARRRGASTTAKRVSTRGGPRTRSRRGSNVTEQVESISVEQVDDSPAKPTNTESEAEVVTLDTETSVEENQVNSDKAPTDVVVSKIVTTSTIEKEDTADTGDKEVVVETVEEIIENLNGDESKSLPSHNDMGNIGGSETNESGGNSNADNVVGVKTVSDKSGSENPPVDKMEIEKPTDDTLEIEKPAAETAVLEKSTSVVLESDKVGNENSVIQDPSKDKLDSVQSTGSNPDAEDREHAKSSVESTRDHEHTNEKRFGSDSATEKRAKQLEKAVEEEASVEKPDDVSSEVKIIEKEITLDTPEKESGKGSHFNENDSNDKGANEMDEDTENKDVEAIAIAAEISLDMDDPPLPSQDRSASEMTDTPSQRSREARPDPHPVDPEIPPTTSTAETGSERTRRRTSGRALRKNTVGPRTREAEAAAASATGLTPERNPTRPMTRGAGVSSPSKPNGVAASDSDAANQRRGGTPPGRALRTRRTSGGEDPVTPLALATPPRRRGRPPLHARKRNVEERSPEEEQERIVAKRRRMAVDDAEARVVTRRPVGRPRGSVTFRDDVERQTRKEMGSPPVASRARNSEESADKVSSSVITAIAVDAALESAKAVIDPLNERLTKLMKELETVVRDLVAQKGEMDAVLANTSPITPASARANKNTVAVPPTQAPSPGTDLNTPVPSPSGQSQAGKQQDTASSPRAIPQTVTIAALENFQLDVSEIIGGGEARLRAHASLSQQEFETLHRIIDHQGKALRELDRLLTAAQAFSLKANKNGNGANGTAGDPAPVAKGTVGDPAPVAKGTARDVAPAAKGTVSDKPTEASVVAAAVSDKPAAAAVTATVTDKPDAASQLTTKTL